MNNMNKKNLKKMSKSQLINMIYNLKKSNIVIVDDDSKPIPTPRIKPNNVKQMIQKYEENIIQPPKEFMDGYKPIAAPRNNIKHNNIKQQLENIIKPIPRTIKNIYSKQAPIPIPRTIKNIYSKQAPIPIPKTKIVETNKALKGYTKSYEVNIKNNKDPLLQLQNTRKGVESYLENILTSMKGIKYVETLKVTFEKNIDENQTVYKTAYFNCKTQTITNNIEITETLQQSKQQIINIIAQWISEGSGWTVSSVDAHYINIIKV